MRSDAELLVETLLAGGDIQMFIEKKQEQNVTHKIKRKSSTDEWIVRKYVNGKPDEKSDYFTNDKEDAVKTLNLIKSKLESFTMSDRMKKSHQRRRDLKQSGSKFKPGKTAKVPTK